MGWGYIVDENIIKYLLSIPKSQICSSQRSKNCAMVEKTQTCQYLIRLALSFPYLSEDFTLIIVRAFFEYKYTYFMIDCLRGVVSWKLLNQSLSNFWRIFWIVNAKENHRALFNNTLFCDINGQPSFVRLCWTLGKCFFFIFVIKIYRNS